MSFDDFSVPRRQIDTSSVRVSCISTGSPTVALVQPTSGATPQFAFVAFSKPVVDLGQGTYSLPYDRDFSRSGLPVHSESRGDQLWPAKSELPVHSRTSLIADSAVRYRQVPSAGDCTEIRAGIIFKHAVHAHDLFIQIRSLVNCTDCDSVATRDSLRDALLLDRVMIEVLVSAAATVLRKRNLKDDVRDDLSQEAVMILRKRLPSPRLHFRDEGILAFVTWLDEVALRACGQAARTARVARRRHVTFVSPERLAPIDTSSQQNEVDERDFSEQFKAKIDQLPVAEMREVVRGIHGAEKLVEIARHLGISDKRVARFRDNAFKELRRIWPQGDAGLHD